MILHNLYDFMVTILPLRKSWCCEHKLSHDINLNGEWAVKLWQMEINLKCWKNLCLLAHYIHKVVTLFMALDRFVDLLLQEYISLGNFHVKIYHKYGFKLFDIFNHTLNNKIVHPHTCTLSFWVLLVHSLRSVFPPLTHSLCLSPFLSHSSTHTHNWGWILRNALRSVCHNEPHFM